MESKENLRRIALPGLPTEAKAVKILGPPDVVAQMLHTDLLVVNKEKVPFTHFWNARFV